MAPLIVELELWSLPRVARTPFDGKDAAERCRSETGLASTVVLGLSFVPDSVDVQNLRNALQQGEVRQEEFRAFCLERGLESEAGNERSAAEFLAYVEGQALAWLHLPAEEGGLSMARTMVAWAASNSMQLRDGASTYEALSEKQVYALWRQ